MCAGGQGRGSFGWLLNIRVHPVIIGGGVRCPLATFRPVGGEGTPAAFALETVGGGGNRTPFRGCERRLYWSENCLSPRGVDWALLVTVASVLSSLWLRTTVCRTIVLALLALQTTHQPTLFLSTTPKVMEMKKIQQAGGTCQGEYNPTWLKQPGDNLTLIFGAGLVGYGAILSCVGYYRLATGKGKKE